MRSYAAFGRVAIAAAILAAGAAVQPASAALITESYSFSFNSFDHVPAPADPLSGQFMVTFDPGGGEQSGPLDSFTSNFTTGIAGTAVWDFVYLPSSNVLGIGDDCTTFCTVTPLFPGSAAIAFFWDPLSVDFANYAAGGISYSSETGSITPVMTAVPEPGALALFASALVGLMGLLPRRRRNVVENPKLVRPWMLMKIAGKRPIFTVFASLLLVAAIFIPSRAKASIVQYDFTGQVTDIPLGFLVTDNGAKITGSIIFDTGAPVTFDNGTFVDYGLTGTITIDTSFYHFSGPITVDQFTLGPSGDQFFVGSDVLSGSQSAYLSFDAPGPTLTSSLEIGTGRTISFYEFGSGSSPGLNEADGQISSLTLSINESSSTALILTGLVVFAGLLALTKSRTRAR